MNKAYSFFSFLFLMVSYGISAQEGASSCAELQANFQQYQSCATSIPFQNSSTPSTENFNTSCILEPLHGPTWFYMKIKTPGSITLQISQESNSGQQTDVDFVLWGPFTTLNNICDNLHVSNEVDCSWSVSSTEIAHLPNAQAGELYVLLVDNYEQSPGQISIAQTAGTGSSDCSFLSSVEITATDGTEISQLDYCAPATKDIMAKVDTSDFTGNPGDLRFNYKWYKDNVLISTILASASSTNILTVSQTGNYSLEMTAYDSTDASVDQNTLPVSTDDIQLNFYFAPDFFLQNTNTQCLDSNPVLKTVDNSANLQAYTFDWYRNGTAVTGAHGDTFSPVLPGIYTSKISNAGCSAVETNSVQIYSKPQVIISGNKTICENDSYQITSNITNAATLANTGYQWIKDGNPIAGATNPDYTVNVANQPANTTASYTLEVTEQGLCTGVSNAAQVTVNAKPNINTTPVQLQQCDYITPNNDGIALVNLTQAYGIITNGDNLLALSYFLDAGLTQPVANPAAFTNTVAYSQTIYVTGQYPGQVPLCASAVASIQLTISPTSVSNYPNMAPVCPELNAAYGLADFDSQRSLIKNTYYPATNVGIEFYLSQTDAAVEQNQLTNASMIPLGISTVYSRIETGINCAGIGTFTVEVYNAPLQNTISALNACQSETVILATKDGEALSGQQPSVQSAYFYSFENAKNNVGAISKNAAISFPAGTNPVYVRLTDTVTQCFSIVNFNVVIFPNPSINNPSEMSVCGTSTAIFDLTARISQIIGNNANYQVSFYETQADLLANNPIADPTAYESASKTIFIKVADPINHGCESRTTLSLKISQSPGNSINPEIIQICDNSGFAAFDLTQHEFQMAGATPINEIGFKYYTSLPDAQANNGNTIASPQAFTNTTADFQKIYVRINSKINFDSETGIACYRILEQELYVRPYPANNLLTTSYKICVDINGKVENEALIDADLPDSDYNFLWYRGFDADPASQILGAYGHIFHTPDQGQYSVRITDLTNSALCATIVNFSTEKTVIPFSVKGDPTELVAFETDNTITAIVNPPTGDYMYQLNDNGWQQSNVFTNIKEGIYNLTVRNTYGCGEVSTQIVVVDFPRFFTPNNDGFNDTWNIGGRIGLDISNVYIFDRSGKLLKEISRDENGWDGTLNGKPLPSDDYWFKIIYVKDGAKKEFLNHFALKR